MNVQYTDTQLKQALAKMLPKVIWLNTTRTSSGPVYCWWNQRDSLTGLDREVLDTELLHLCWLVETALTSAEQIQYIAQLWKDNQPAGFTGGYTWEPQALSDLIWWTLAHATWQQRTIALAKVKGVEIV